MGERLIIKITHDNIPLLRDRYPFIYLERGRLEIDDSSVKWINSEGFVVRLPIATISTILLGPGTSVTHEAIKVMSSANTTVCWIGEDSLLFYAVGQSPTHDIRKMMKQIEIFSNEEKRTEVARRMFLYRFPKEEVSNSTIQNLMGKEGLRVRKLYSEKAEKYNVGWKGRSYTPGNFELSDITNKILTSANTALYALISSIVFSIGYTPYVGFIHAGSPLPFVYDLADLYKEELCIDMAFKKTFDFAGMYNRYEVLDEFRERVSAFDLFSKVPKDIEKLFKDL